MDLVSTSDAADDLARCGSSLQVNLPTLIAAPLYAPGKITLTRSTGGNVMVYAVTKSTVTASQVSPSLAVAAACSNLEATGAEDLCRDATDPQGLAEPCKAGAQGIPLMDTYEVTYAKVCALCPPGTFSDAGTGCTACPSGNANNVVGSVDCPDDCGPGTYSHHGSSTCLPCTTGTYSDSGTNSICMECPADSNNWLPGSTTCLRCIKGIPYTCKEGSNNCHSGGQPLAASSPGSHIVKVSTMNTCALSASYEIKAWTKCLTWKGTAPGGTAQLQFALEVAGDCSIDVLLMTDPSPDCSEPLTETPNYKYGQLQMRMFYQSTDTIRSVLPSDDYSSSYLASIENNSGTLNMHFWGASTDPGEAVPTSTACTTTLTTMAGQVSGLPGLPINTLCPPGSYYVKDEYCYKCPTGYTCPGGAVPIFAVKTPCATETANPIYGLGGVCPPCDTASNGGYTSFNGADYCRVQFPDRECTDTTFGFYYNDAHKKCELCIPGTYRALPGSLKDAGTGDVHTAEDDLAGSRLCQDCPEGTYSVVGARGLAQCVKCPKGQEAISGVTGQHCLVCPEGSLALLDTQAAIDVVDAGMPLGATTCDPCPAGTWQDTSNNALACKSCTDWPVTGVWTYRNGDAAPENNECRRVPSGFKLKQEDKTAADPAVWVLANSVIELCPVGQISFWNTAATTRIPANPLTCIACSELDATLNLGATPKYANTYAPRAGMMNCIPAPAGTVPVYDSSARTTSSYAACPNGKFRDAYSVSITCTDCGPGKEVGPSNKQDCIVCRPGYYLDAGMVAQKKNYCTPCPKDQYRSNFGATTCMLCPRGTDTQDNANTDCTNCPIGYYNGVAGTPCDPAPAGTYVNTIGAYYATPCPKGTFNNEPAQDNCNSCPPGKYSSTLGARECKTCAAGTFSKGQSAGCTDCRPGYAAASGSSACVPCKPGTYAPDSKSPECKLCLKGYQCPTSAMKRVGGCPRGTYSNKEGNKLCTPCPQNTYSLGGTSTTSALACIKCHPKIGHNVSARGEGPNGEEEVWFGRLVSFVVISRDNAEESWAFVQWYAEAAHNETTALTRMSRLKWCKHQRCIGRTGELSRMEYYDLIPLTKIIKPTPTRTSGAYCSFKLDLVESNASDDPLVTCGASLQINIAADCKVSVTPLATGSHWVPGVWSGVSEQIAPALAACPTEESAKVAATGGASATATAVRAAIQSALNGFVYGFTAGGTVQRSMGVTSIAFAAGTFTASKPSAQFTWAVTQNTAVPAEVHASLSVVSACSQLGSSTRCKDGASPEALGTLCPDGKQGIFVGTAVKVCALCPAGTYGDGIGCSPCDAGTAAPLVGSSACGADCDAGTYSEDGFSTCLPCPVGTYSDGETNTACTVCPAGSSAWAPGSTTCLRCIDGIPFECKEGDGNCEFEGEPLPDGSPGKHVLSVGQMGSCTLSGSYEVKARSKCTSWGNPSPVVQLALEVASDCSIDVLPISDPACFDPLATSYKYSEVAVQAYYVTLDTIRSALPDVGTSAPMLGIDVVSGNLRVSFWATSADPAATVPATVCSSAATATGGQVNGLPATLYTDCPAGTYAGRYGFCWACPTGYTCTGGPSALPKPCAAGTFNPILGLSGACTACTPATNGGYTSSKGAATCSVPYIDRACPNATVGTEYDLGARDCVKCAPGSYRPLAGSIKALGTPNVLHTAGDDGLQACLDCPPGTYSGDGALGLAQCLPCPKGQFNPSPGLGDQTSRSGLKCFGCPAGSIALREDMSAETATDATMPTGATFCDACPAGTWQDTSNNALACKSCTAYPDIGPGSYRTGDATPENNECKPVPSGYKLKDDSHSKITPCEAGRVAFWENGDRVPADGLACAACSSLDGLAGGKRFAHTYAPRKGMTTCLPCPSGTVPLNDVSGATTKCAPCGAGTYRTAVDISATCLPCGAGREAGPSANQACNSCRPGTYMTAEMAADNQNYCAGCPKNTYRTWAGATSCLACPRGTETQDAGNTECEECPVGHYNNKEGTPCVAAQAGTYVNTTGAYWSLPCPKGTFTDEAGSDACTACPPGKYSNNFGSSQCKDCAAGTYSSGAAASCLDCRPSFFSTAGAASCSPCKPGTYAPSSKTGQCKLCPKGYQCPSNALMTPSACPRGTFSNREGQRLCSPCPANTYSLGGTSTIPVMACIKCPSGSNTRGLSGQSACVAIRPQTRRMRSSMAMP
ncbi:pro convertase subtilisin kexin type 5-like [Micractinium conductrix]|uniref:Pro convertase subtilisin kexin type 5-like n=1 Tax=Micractinium conductrix TaxID=554055 RepID=A0A2P6V6P7_9CHLO|nr:pro convertase subtilisin kexin type 5-like [Micractinium conductrix]|eukprot:PSC69766.1 pro convertase subtilisin kexin type 5-like [Micractinium conductrix]